MRAWVREQVSPRRREARRLSVGKEKNRGKGIVRLTARAGLAAAQGKGKGAGRLCRPCVCWAETAQGAARFGPGEEG